MADLNISTIGTVVKDVVMPTNAKIGAYVYESSTGLTGEVVIGTNPKYIKLSATSGILLDSGSTAVDTPLLDSSEDAWQYSNYLIEPNKQTKIALLKLHIIELENAAKSPYQQSTEQVTWTKTNNIFTRIAELEKELKRLERTRKSMFTSTYGGGL